MAKQAFSYKNLMVGWSLFILLLTLFPFSKIQNFPEPRFELTDKIIHGCLFGIHSFLLSGYLSKKILRRAAIYPAVFLLSFLFGLFIEISQYFIPERSFELYDLAANATGILAGMFVFYIKINFFAN